MAGLNRDVIVAAAFEILDEGGVTAITARSVAARLGVKPGALYYHVADMGALRNEMATAIMRELTLNNSDFVHVSDDCTSTATHPDWRSVLTRMAIHVRSVLLRYRDGAKLFSGTALTDDETIGSMEVPLGVLTVGGLELVDALRSVQTVYNYVIGYVIEEQHRAANPVPYDPGLRRAHIDPQRFPLTTAANEAFTAVNDDAFAWGVETIIAGIAARV